MCAALQIIDLDMLDRVGSAKGVEELRVQLKQQVSLAVCCAVARILMLLRIRAGDLSLSPE